MQFSSYCKLNLYHRFPHNKKEKNGKNLHKVYYALSRNPFNYISQPPPNQSLHHSSNPTIQQYHQICRGYNKSQSHLNTKFVCQMSCHGHLTCRTSVQFHPKGVLLTHHCSTQTQNPIFRTHQCCLRPNQMCLGPCLLRHHLRVHCMNRFHHAGLIFCPLSHRSPSQCCQCRRIFHHHLVLFRQLFLSN